MPGFVSVLAFAWSYWRRHGRRIFLLALMLAGATLAEINIPVWIGRLIDALGATSPVAAVHALVVILGLSLTFQVFHKGGDYLRCRLAVDVMRQIGADAFARVQRYSTEWHANTLAGSTVRKITRGIWAFDDFGDALYISLLPAAAVVLGVAILTAVHWPLMGILLIAGAALYTAISTYMASAYVSPRWRYAVEADSRLGGSLADASTCIGVVKTAGAERREDERLAELLESWRTTIVIAHRLSTVQQVDRILVFEAGRIVEEARMMSWSQGRMAAIAACTRPRPAPSAAKERSRIEVRLDKRAGAVICLRPD